MDFLITPTASKIKFSTFKITDSSYHKYYVLVYSVSTFQDILMAPDLVESAKNLSEGKNQSSW